MDLISLSGSHLLIHWPAHQPRWISHVDALPHRRPHLGDRLDYNSQVGDAAPVGSRAHDPEGLHVARDAVDDGAWITSRLARVC